MTKRATEWLIRATHDDIDRSQLTSAMDTQLSEFVARSFANQTAPLGALSSLRYVEQTTIQGNRLYLYDATFAGGHAKWIFALDAAGKVSGMTLVPAGS